MTGEPLLPAGPVEDLLRESKIKTVLLHSKHYEKYFHPTRSWYKEGINIERVILDLVLLYSGCQHWLVDHSFLHKSFFSKPGEIATSSMTGEYTLIFNSRGKKLVGKERLCGALTSTLVATSFPIAGTVKI